MTRGNFVRLADIATQGQYGLNAAAMKQGKGIRYVRITDIDEHGTLRSEGAAYVPLTTENIDSYRLEPGDLLIARSGATAGKSLLFRGLEESAVFAGYLIRFRLDVTQALPEYVRYYLRSNAYWNYIKATTRAVAQPNINAKELACLPIPLPAIPEQRRIVDLLSRAEGIVRLRREAEKKAAELIPALFLEMFGDPATNPKGWVERRLGDLAEKISDGPFGSNLKTSHYVESGVRVIRLQNIGIGELIDDAKAYVSPEHFASLPRHRCLPSDVIIGTLGDPNLRAFVLPPTIPEALNKADCVQFRCLQNVVSPAYVCWLMNMPSTLAMAASLVQGITLTRISMGRLREMIVPVPPFDVQQDFADRVEMMDSIKYQQVIATAKAQAAFEALLARCFTPSADDHRQAIAAPRTVAASRGL